MHSIAASALAVLSASAQRYDHQPSPDERFAVYLDGMGHLMGQGCLTRAARQSRERAAFFESSSSLRS